MCEDVNVNLVCNPGFMGADGSIKGWEFISPREELKTDHSFYISDDRTFLVISARGDKRDFGCWRAEVKLEEGKWYRASVKVRTKGIASPDISVFAQVGLHYLLPKGRWSGETLLEQVFKYHNPQDGNRFELYLRSTKSGSVEWSDPCVVEIPEPVHRMVRAAAVRFGQLPGLLTVDEQRMRIKQKLNDAGALKPDIVALTEICTMCGVKREDYEPYTKIGESVPDGPTCRILSDAARRYGMYVMAGIAEMRGKYLMNTAVLFDRQGNFTGQYDKNHLTFGELMAGFSCGSGYPTFDTDFGRIGIHICYDEWFPEVSRYYAHKGVEVLFLVVMGGKPITWRTRALDNGIYFVAAATNPPSMIIDSSGAIIAQNHDDGAVYADLNLDYRKVNWYQDPTWTYGMPCIVPQMRNCLDNEYVKELAGMIAAGIHRKAPEE